MIMSDKLSKYDPSEWGFWWTNADISTRKRWLREEAKKHPSENIDPDSDATANWTQINQLGLSGYMANHIYEEMGRKHIFGKTSDVGKFIDKMREIHKPFAGFKDWDDCKRQGNSDRLCGWLKHRTEDKSGIQVCPICDGKGVAIDFRTDKKIPCPTCNGKGYYVMKSITEDIAKVIFGMVIGYGGVMAISKLKTELNSRGIKPEAVDAGIATALATTIGTIALRRKANSIIKYDVQAPKSVIIEKSVNQYQGIITNVRVGNWVKYGDDRGVVVSVNRNYATILKDGNVHEQIHIKSISKIGKTNNDLCKDKEGNYTCAEGDCGFKTISEDEYEDHKRSHKSKTKSDESLERIWNNASYHLRTQIIESLGLESSVKNYMQWKAIPRDARNAIIEAEDDNYAPAFTNKFGDANYAPNTEPPDEKLHSKKHKSQYSCPVCKTNFDKEIERRKHLHDNHFTTITVEDKVETIDMHKSKQYACNNCSFMSKESGKVAEHEAETGHTMNKANNCPHDSIDPKNNMCRDCGKIFKSDSSGTMSTGSDGVFNTNYGGTKRKWSRTKSIVKTEDDEVHCPLCGRDLGVSVGRSKEERLQVHLRNNHGATKSDIAKVHQFKPSKTIYGCDTCGFPRNHSNHKQTDKASPAEAVARRLQNEQEQINIHTLAAQIFAEAHQSLTKIDFKPHIAIVRFSSKNLSGEVGAARDRQMDLKIALDSYRLHNTYEGADFAVKVMSQQDAVNLEKVLDKTDAYVVNQFTMKADIKPKKPKEPISTDQIAREFNDEMKPTGKAIPHTFRPNDDDDNDDNCELCDKPESDPSHRKNKSTIQYINFQKQSSPRTKGRHQLSYPDDEGVLWVDYDGSAKDLAKIESIARRFGGDVSSTRGATWNNAAQATIYFKNVNYDKVKQILDDKGYRYDEN